MYLIQRRILARIAAQTLMVFAFVGVIVTTTQVLNQVFRLIDASSNMWVAARMFGWLVPTIAVGVLPLAFLIGCVNVYDQMDDERETVILTGTGVHPMFALVPAAVMAAAVSLLVLVLSLFVEPTANRAVRDTIHSLQFDALRMLAGDGVLREVQGNLFIRGGGYDEAGEIDGIFILDRRDPAEEVSYVAEKGVFVEDGGRTYLRLVNGSIQYRARDGGDTHKVAFGAYTAEPDAFFGPPGAADYRPRQTTTAALQTQFNDGDEAQFPRDAVQKELIRRYTDWLYPLVFFALTALLVLRGSFSRHGSRWRLPVAVLAGFLIKAGGLVLLGNSGSSEIAARATFALPVAATALLLGLALTAGGRRRRPAPA